MAEAQAKDEGKKSSKKLIMIILGAVLMMAGAAAGGYFFMAYKMGNAGAEAKAGSGEHKEEPVHEEPTVYYDMPTALLVNFPSGASAKVIKISLTILLVGEASVAIMKKHEPMIRNNLLMVVSTIGADKAKTLEGKQALRAAMLAEVGKVLEKMAGKNTAKDVYFTDFVMQ